MRRHGLHHVTAVTGHAAENVTFYTGVLGLRLVKKTVNQDNPSAHHLFYGDGDAAHLGERLALPPFLEPQRAAIGAGLRPLPSPALTGAGVDVPARGRGELT